MPDEALSREREAFRQTLVRNLVIAIAVGAVIAARTQAPSRALFGSLLALWPSLGGHFVEIAFLDVARPRLPRARWVQASARIVWWLAGGALLGCAVIATAHALSSFGPTWRAWWKGGPIFVGIELVAHGWLAARGRPSFYRGDG